MKTNNPLWHGATSQKYFQEPNTNSPRFSSIYRNDQEIDSLLLSVIVPVYNEERTLHNILSKVVRAEPQNKEILIIDDCSCDNSRQILKSWENQPNVLVLYHNANRGKGAAIRTALEHVKGKYSIIQDGDLEYDPNDYMRLLEPLMEGVSDVVYGSRHLGRLHGNQDRSFLNPFRLGVTALNITFRLLYHKYITDEATCYKLFPTSVLKAMQLECERFEFCPEVTAKAACMNLRLLEVPIHYQPRGIKEGKKIKLKDAIEAFQTLWKWRNWKPQ